MIISHALVIIFLIIAQRSELNLTNLQLFLCGAIVLIITS
jgi:hypothetical protein